MLKNYSRANFTLYPLLWLSVWFAGGILIAKFSSFNWEISLLICLTTTVSSILFFKRKWNLVLLSLAFTSLGALCFQIENLKPPPERLKMIYDENRLRSGEPLEIEGVLQDRPELTAGGFFLKLKTDKTVYKGEIWGVSGIVKLFAPVSDEQVSAEYAALNLQTGSRLRVACRLRREDEFQDPGIVSQTEILDQQEIDATAAIKSPLLMEKLGDEERFAPLDWIFEQRENLIREFKKRFSVSTAGIMIASLLGNKYFLDKPAAELFREGGTFHVLVISGLHITFIGGLTLLLLRFFTKKRLWQFIIASVFLWGYSIAVGADVPVVRATIMFTVLLFSQVIYRRGTLLNSLGLCALILLVWRPNDIFTASFQLTFVSVTAIVACAFPLIENLRRIGSWSPSVETPFPPAVSLRLKRFCEMLYWRESGWKIESKRQIWSAQLFKSSYLKWLEARNWQGIAAYLFEGLVVSLIVQIWLLPLLIVYFHRVSPVSILLNLWVGIFIALEGFAAITAVIFAQLSDFLAFPLIKLTEILNWFLLALPKILVENPWASFRVPAYAGGTKAIYVLYFLPLLILTVALNRWKPFELGSKSKVQSSESEAESANSQNEKTRRNRSQSRKYYHLTACFLWQTAFILTIIFHPFSAPKADGRLHIDFLDVGQGDAALVTFPNGETLLVDGGGRPNFNNLYVKREDEAPEFFEPDTQTIGEKVVCAFLWEKGYSEIDYILATHADADHIQGLTDVAKNFRVKAAFFGRTPEKDADFAELSAVLRKKKIEIVKLMRGDVLSFGEVKAEILYPETDESPEAVSDNNHSVVLHLVYGAKSFLLTGDIEKETERSLVQNPAVLQADVVKVAHHGSRTSSIKEFIEATRAEFAIISVGRESPFGHPHAEVLERWKTSGAKILTTGENGTISVSTGGQDLQIQTFIRQTVFR